MNEKLHSELNRIKKENFALRRRLEETQKREKSLLSKIYSLQSHLKEIQEKNINILHPALNIQIQAKINVPKTPQIPPNTLSLHANERSLKKKSKSKEDISPSVKLLDDVRSCK